MMKCQHCGSTDIVAIQGQNYCLSCGRAVGKAASGKAKAATVATSGPLNERAAKLPKRRKVAAKPVPVPKAKKAVKPAVPVESVVPTAASGASESLYASAATATAKPSAPSSARPRSIDLRAPLHHAGTVRSVHPLRFSLTVATVLGLVIGLAVGLALWFQLDTDLTLYLTLAGLVAVIITSMLAQSALMYGISRTLDGRPAPHAYWWAAARSGFMDVLNANMITLITLVLIGVLGLAGWRLSLTASALSMPLRLGLFAIINLVLAWLLLGTYVARRVALPAIIVGGVTAGAGVRVGWRLYRHSGGHLLLTGLEALLGRLAAVIFLITAIVATAYSLVSPTQLEIVVGSGVAAALAVFVLAMVMLEWETRVWLRQYRRVVNLFAPAERVRLLTGRIQSRS